MSLYNIGRIFVRGTKWIDDRSTVRFEWVLNHLGLLRWSGFSALAIGCLRITVKLAAWVLSAFASYLHSLDQAEQAMSGMAGGAGVGSLLDKINTVAPVVECFQLLAGLAGLWCGALSFKMMVTVYKAIPFKAT